MSSPLYLVDAFTREPFSGNPAAICLLERVPETPWMQRVAAEMNCSETAFVVPVDQGYSLRWFTPTAEVDLCGHATLAGAHVLWQTGRHSESEPLSFETNSGPLICRRDHDWINMVFPREPVEQVDPPDGLYKALQLEPSRVGFYGENRFDGLLEVDSPRVLHDLSPDFAHLAQIETRGIIVTCGAPGQEYDFRSRFFAPSVGIPEDPVTGSAHCALAPFWADRLQKDEMVGYQDSNRGGTVRVRLQPDGVVLSGQAVTVLEADLIPEPQYLPPKSDR